MNTTAHINDIASKHLGRASDGTVVKPYETPDLHDPSLLVGVPRQLNRTHLGINDQSLPFVGFDLWNAYEVSFLLDNGYPVSGIARIIYPCQSPNIVESKSLKLYLNSFNMERMGKTLKHAATRFVSLVTTHLCNTLGIVGGVKVSFFSPSAEGKHFIYNEADPNDDIHKGYMRVERYVDVTKLQFADFTENPSLLRLEDNPCERDGRPVQAITTNALRSNCRVTNQPDWGDVYLVIDSDQVVDMGSFLQYIVSMRKENHFHEEICETIYKRLHDILPEKSKLMVACLYTRRGGIDINPVRATNRKMIEMYMPYVFDINQSPFKTIRQ